MGSVRRSASGSWQARYRDPLGRQRTRSFATKADARAFLGLVDLELAQGRWRDPNAGNVAFRDACQVWLESNPAKRATTLARDATVLRAHVVPLLGDVPMNRLTPGHVQSVVNEMIAKG